MNNATRKQLETLKAGIDAGPINTLCGELEEIRDAEQEKRDNIPEALQEGEQAAKLDAAIEALDEAISKLQEIDEALGEVQDFIDQAVAS